MNLGGHVVNAKELKEQDDLIELIIQSYSEGDILSASRRIGIDPKEFYAEGLTIKKLANDFVLRVYQLGKVSQLNEYVAQTRVGINSRINISDKSAEKFSLLLNNFLEKLNDIDEADFEESELFDPIEFEDKMRNRAKLSEDIIKQGILLKPDIVVLRRKANALDYGKYSKLIQKLAKYYIFNICGKYPSNEYSANRRFIELRKELLEMIPEALYDKDDETEEYIDGIIFDTISKCLIFND